MILRFWSRKKAGEPSNVSSASTSVGTRVDFDGIEATLRDGRASEARRLCEDALAHAPDAPRLLALVGNACLADGDPQEAIDHFNLALHYDPAMDEVVRPLVKALQDAGRPGEIEGLLGDVLARNPRGAVALFEAALHAERHSRPDAAIAHLERLLEAHPQHVDGMSLLAVLLMRERADDERAERLLREAVRYEPTHAAAHANLGWVLGARGDVDGAASCFARALELAPGDAETRLMRSIALLGNRRFESGWVDFDARRRVGGRVPEPYGFPRWSGADPVRGALLLVQEQGLGDQIMFASCLREAMPCAQRLVVDCEPRLVSLFARSFPGVEVVGRKPEAPALNLNDRGIAAQALLGDLPGIFRRSLDAFPDHRGYLIADVGSVEAMRARLRGLGDGMRIGISWRGGTRVTGTRQRSFDLSEFHPIVEQIPGTYVSLQYGSVAGEIARFGCAGARTIHHWQEVVDDIDLTASLIQALDVVITVCTTVAHLAGALGKPCFILAPRFAEWRYGVAGSSLPWYPSARIFRQGTPGQWGDVIAAVIEGLKSQRDGG